MKSKFVATLCLFLCLGIAQAELPNKNVKLPEPDKTGGAPLMKALSERSSNREFLADKEIPLQTLSDLLWAACGINRPESGRRTAPTAMNWQDIKLYIFTKDGIYSYDAASHSLEFVAEGNHMKSTGEQSYVENASCNIIFVSDIRKMKTGAPEDKLRFASFHSGAVSQNISLYCASSGLNTVVRASFDEEKLRSLLRLQDDERIIMAQSIGFRPPKK